VTRPIRVTGVAPRELSQDINLTRAYIPAVLAQPGAAVEAASAKRLATNGVVLIQRSSEWMSIRCAETTPLPKGRSHTSRSCWSSMSGASVRALALVTGEPRRRSGRGVVYPTDGADVAVHGRRTGCVGPRRRRGRSRCSTACTELSVSARSRSGPGERRGRQRVDPRRQRGARRPSTARRP
jgi:hypothetical protein